MESLILAHLVGDYLFQNDAMALNKKKSSKWCLIHIATYMLPFLLCGLSATQFLLIAAQHYIQDRTIFVAWFMRVTGKSCFMNQPTGPWSMIVIDNIFHILWMSFVINFL